MQIILETERLYLREMEQGDFDDLCKILQDEETMYAYEGAFIPASIMRFIISNATSLSVHPFVFGQENFSVCPVLQYPYLSILRAKAESLDYGIYSFQMLSAGFCWRNSIYSHSCRYHKPLCLGFRYSGNPVWCLYALSP